LLGVEIAIFGVLVVRLGFYSAALASHVGSRPRHERFLMAAAVIDQLVVACIDRFSTGDLDEQERAAYFRGAAALTVSGWVAAHTVGMLIPAALPESLCLTAAAPLVYAGLLARSTRSADSVMVALASGLCAVVLVDLPAQTSVPVAVIIGMMTCGVLDRRGAGS
jgi:predicted branched-subunit amino acid permease